MPCAIFRTSAGSLTASNDTRVLLDAGTWAYFKDGVVMKDRAPSIGERGHSQTGDFSGICRE